MSNITRMASVATAAAIGVADMPAFASDTVSSGESYQTDYRYGEYTTNYSYLSHVTPIVSGQIVEPDFELFSYNDINGAGFQELKAKLVPAYPLPKSYDIGGAMVTVEAWEEPTLAEQWENLIDAFFYVNQYTEVSTVVTRQQTSGDGPDPEVPIGFRGECFSYGSDGPTNFGAFDGYFADCSDYSTITVAPGEINNNTHTTTIYTDVQEETGNIDMQIESWFALTPLLTRSTSSGTLELATSRTVTIRHDDYATALTGRLEGTTLFDETVAGNFTDPAVEARVAELTATRAIGWHGAPVALVWSAPTATGSTTALESSTQESAITLQSYNVDTIQIIQNRGPAVFAKIGDRGACRDTGLSGTLDDQGGNGALADCDDGIVYALSPLETLTNTHTTAVTETTTTTTTTDTYLTTSGYAFSATAVPIGTVHGAVQEGLLQLGMGSAMHREALTDGRFAPADRKFGIWLAATTGRRSTASKAGLSGLRMEGEDAGGGAALRLGAGSTLGLSFTHRNRDLAVAGHPESAAIRLNGASVAWAARHPGWQASIEAGKDWGRVRSQHGSAALGGISRTSESVAITGVRVQAGPRLTIGGLTLMPTAGAEWTRVRLGGFTESGGLALRGPAETSERLFATYGAMLGKDWTTDGGAVFGITAGIDGRSVLSGRRPARVVYLAGAPATALAVESAHQPSTGTSARIGARLTTPQGIGITIDGSKLVGDALTGWMLGARAQMAF